MALYDRKAGNLSADLFNSVYDDLYALAMRQQKGIWRAAKGKRGAYSVGDAQEMLTNFCANKASLGDALDFISYAR